MANEYLPGGGGAGKSPDEKTGKNDRLLLDAETKYARALTAVVECDDKLEKLNDGGTPARGQALKLQGQLEKLSNTLDLLDTFIRQTPADTLEGMLVKVRCLHIEHYDAGNSSDRVLLDILSLAGAETPKNIVPDKIVLSEVDMREIKNV